MKKISQLLTTLITGGALTFCPLYVEALSPEEEEKIRQELSQIKEYLDRLDKQELSQIKEYLDRLDQDLKKLDQYLENNKVAILDASHQVTAIEDRLDASHQVTAIEDRLQNQTNAKEIAFKKH